MYKSPIAAAVAAAVTLAGCATAEVDATWRNIDTPANYLRGATVLVSCDGGDQVLQHICEDQISADLSAHGVKPLLPAPGSVSAMPPGVSDMQYIPAARDGGAKAVFSVTLGLNAQHVSEGFTLGVSGFGFGRNSVGGVGVAAPIGGGQVTSGYAANGRVTDVASGRLMWTARASAPPSADLNAQLADLSKSVMAAASIAGLF